MLKPKPKGKPINPGESLTDYARAITTNSQQAPMALNVPATPQPSRNGSTPHNAVELQPIGESVFGYIYNKFKGKVKEAFEFITRTEGGDLLGVFHRDSLGDIDLVWGDKKGGLEHIIDKHVGKNKSFKNINDLAERLNDIIENGTIDFENGDKVVFKKGNELVTVRKNFRVKGKKIADKNWILSAYNEMSADEGNSAITNINQGKAAPATEHSTHKGTTNSQTSNELNGKIVEAESDVNTNPTEAQKEAGTKHSIFRHYNTDSGVINADDILLIPDVIANGTRTVKNNGKIEYKYSHNNGTKYTVLTENKKGREEFADFYTNKSGSARSSNTQLSAQADSITALSADKDNINSVNNKTRFRSIAADNRTADYALDTIEQATADYADTLNTERGAIIDAITPAPGDSLHTILSTYYEIGDTTRDLSPTKNAHLFGHQSIFISSKYTTQAITSFIYR